MKKIDILGINISAITKEEALFDIEKFLQGTKKHLICTVNSEFIVKSLHNQAFAEILNSKSNINVADGIGIVWAGKFLSLKSPKNKILRIPISLLQWLVTILAIIIYPKWLYSPLPDRIAGVDLMVDISKIAARDKKSIFLLGGGPTVAEQTALKLQTDIVDLKVAGINDQTPKETAQIVKAINKSKADILFVAFGSEKQEVWIENNFSKITPKLAMGVGGSFDFISGRISRAPRFIQKIGLEWLYRLAIEPSRIKRQLTIPYFMLLVLKEKIQN